MKKDLLGLSLLAAASSLLLTGCVVEHRHYGRHGVVVRETAILPAPVIGTELIVAHAPPPPRTEVVVVRPGARHVWIPGCWGWRGGAWAWDVGRWELPPRPGAVWVPHRYVLRGGAHVYVHGGWRL